jgi:hypothetical protein
VEKVKVTRVPALTPDIAAAMRVSFNGESYVEVENRVAAGDYAILRGDCERGTSFAIVESDGKTATLHAVEGPGGTELTRQIVAAARRADVACDAWVFCKSRARLAARAGMMPTGARRVSCSGREQLQVSTK